MLKIFIISTLFTFLSNTSLVDTTDNSGWTFIKEQKGAKLYFRQIDGFDYKEVKVILNTNADLKKAKSFLINPNNIETWMSGCTMSVTKKIGTNYSDYYAIFDAPWPITDRDDYGRIELIQDDEYKLHFSFNSIPNGTPSVSNFIRVPYSKGHILINTDKQGRKSLEYQMLVDRGGNLPEYLREYLQQSSPFDTISKLNQVLENI